MGNLLSLENRLVHKKQKDTNCKVGRQFKGLLHQAKLTVKLLEMVHLSKEYNMTASIKLSIGMFCSILTFTILVQCVQNYLPTGVCFVGCQGKIIPAYCKPRGPDQLQHNTSRFPSSNTGGNSMNNSLSAGRKRLRRGTGILLKEMRHNDALFCLQHQGNDGWVSDCRGLGNSDRIRCKFSIGWRFN